MEGQRSGVVSTKRQGSLKAPLFLVELSAQAVKLGFLPDIDLLDWSMSSVVNGSDISCQAQP